MVIQSACFAGPRAAKLPYDETSAGYGRLEDVLKTEIIRLVREGVSEFYTGGQTGVDTLAAQLVLSIRDELGTTARLHLALPHPDMHAGFSALQPGKKQVYGGAERLSDRCGGKPRPAQRHAYDPWHGEKEGDQNSADPSADI